MTVRRFTAYPARSVTSARLGFNINQTVGVATARTRMLEAGATFARWQPSWESIEDYATGTLALPAADAAELAWCAASGVAPVLVAAYGPPYALLTTLTVAAGGAASGSVAITVNESVAAVDAPYCHIRKADGSHIVPEGKWTYPGALIDSVNTTTKTLTLAAATNVALAAGASLEVRRLRYASLPDQDPTNPGVVAFLRYAKFLAQQIYAAGCPEGWVCLWNEVPWAHDKWNDRSALYDSPPGELVANNRLTSILIAAVNVTDLPAGVRFINGASDKTGFSSVTSSAQVAQLATAAQVTNAMAAEGTHPYDDNPEGSAWDPSTTDATYGDDWFQVVNPIDLDTNSRYHARRLAKFAATHGGVAPRLIATECGVDLANDTLHALYLLRRVISLWGMNVAPIIYTLGDNNVGFPVVNPSTYAPRIAHTALARLMAQVALLGGHGGNARRLPTPIGVPDSRWPPVVVGIYGKTGSLLLAWQRTWGTGTTWQSITRPVPSLPVRFHIASGVAIAASVDLLTGSTVTVTPSAGTFTLNLTDAPIAVRTTG